MPPKWKRDRGKDAQIRNWAADRGIDIPPHAPVPPDVREQYDNFWDSLQDRTIPPDEEA